MRGRIFYQAGLHAIPVNTMPTVSKRKGSVATLLVTRKQNEYAQTTQRRNIYWLSSYSVLVFIYSVGPIHL